MTMTDEKLAELRESLRDVASALTGLLLGLHRQAPPEEREILRDLYHLAHDAVDRLRGVPTRRAID
jgi:hypothetical protein